MKQQRAAYTKLMKWEKDCVTEDGSDANETRGKTALFHSRLLQRRFEEAQMLDTKTESENKQATYRLALRWVFNKKAFGDRGGETRGYK